MLAVILVALSANAGTAFAGPGDDMQAQEQRPPRSHGPGREFGGPDMLSPRMLERLGLDDAQSKSVSDIMDAARPEFEDLQGRIRSNRQALLALDASAADYGSKLDRLAAESGALASEMVLLHGRVRGDINAVLTDEQRQKLAERPARSREHAERGSRRHGPG
jgi:Spy/CpxP family protein refolding chaperone